MFLSLYNHHLGSREQLNETKCCIELHDRTILRNAPEDGLIRPKHIVQRDYICDKRRCVDSDIHIYIYLLLIAQQDLILNIRIELNSIELY